MKYIALIAVIGILLLQSTGSIPLASVGGSLTIGLVFIAAALEYCLIFCIFGNKSRT
ncbi:MAG: hypothetical protein M5U33_01825 [Pseudorhodoplanes sp.]|nr:hypothetical protein [Pseudorhodoplanes sp.]